MNTDKTLIKNFAANMNNYPIWYYKELEETEVDDVIFNLLKETFVVELNDKKIAMTFGKNRKHEISCNQSSDEKLDYTSYKTIQKAFTEGKWFRVTKKDTTDEFKENYSIKETERKRISIRTGRIELLTKSINALNSAPEEEKNRLIKELQFKTDEELEELTKLLFKEFENKIYT